MCIAISLKYSHISGYLKSKMYYCTKLYRFDMYV